MSFCRLSGTSVLVCLPAYLLRSVYSPSGKRLNLLLRVFVVKFRSFELPLLRLFYAVKNLAALLCATPPTANLLACVHLLLCSSVGHLLSSFVVWLISLLVSVVLVRRPGYK